MFKLIFIIWASLVKAQMDPDIMDGKYWMTPQNNSGLVAPPESFTRNLNPLYDQNKINEDENFDFIIVGSGSSGSVLANRLSEVNDWKILLLEVGEEASPITDIPMLAVFYQFTQYNWHYFSEKQENMGLGLKDQRMHWPRGRALGGSTIINYMIAVRGNPTDYDRWAAMGNPGWSYEEVLPYFKKLENSTVEHSDEKYRGKSGNVPVTDVPFRTGACDAFVAAAQEAGHSYVDYNGKSQLGVSYVQSTTKNGRRRSAEKAYLRPVRHRPNLKILTKARAVKVLIDPQTKMAYGIQYIKNRRNRVARATKEVILSAGAFNSPQLLMLSGIGPKQHLEELSIKVLKDLPVGQKMYDHIAFVGLTYTLNSSIVLKLRDLVSLETLGQYLEGKGRLTSIGGVESLTYLKTDVSDDPDPLYPDMELIGLGGNINIDENGFHKESFHLSDEVYNTVYKPLEAANSIQIFPMLLHPKSFGYLRLKSQNPYHWPKLYGNFFTDPENHDVRTFIASIRATQKIFAMPALQKVGAKLWTVPIPGCEKESFDSDEYWECALRHVTITLHHQITTCKMGPKQDPEAVVDSRLRVYGIQNLRVADTSIIPLPLSAHTNVPAFMVGEKAADLLKEDWGIRS